MNHSTSFIESWQTFLDRNASMTIKEKKGPGLEQCS